MLFFIQITLVVLLFISCSGNKNLEDSPDLNIGVDFLLERPLPDTPVLSGKRTLVVLQDLKQKKTHSQFLKMLTDIGLETTISPYSSAPKLGINGVWQFDQLIWLADKPKKLARQPKQGDTDLNSPGIFDFVNSGHNLFVASSPDSTKQLSFILRPFGIKSVGRIEDMSTNTDNFEFDLSQMKTLDSFFPNKIFYPPKYLDPTKKQSGTFSFRGAGHISQPASDYDLGLTELDASPSALATRNPNRRKHRLQYTIPLLSATETSISHGVSYQAMSRGKPIPQFRAHGKSIQLATAIQRLNQARMLVLGSLEALSDATFAKSKNSEIISGWLSWLVHQNGVLRLEHISHKRIEAVADDPNYFNLHNISSDTLYSTTDLVTFSVKLVEWAHSESSWTPFTSAEPGSLQIEYSMLHPYYRVPLKHDPSKPGTYSVTFRVPDVYGIYKFALFYQPPGYSNVVSEVLAPVRPFQHNQYSRFIPQAYPYYSAIFTLMVGFLLLSLNLLFGSNQSSKSAPSSSTETKKHQ